MISECGGSQSAYNRPNEETLINHDRMYVVMQVMFISRGI